MPAPLSRSGVHPNAPSGWHHGPESTDPGWGNIRLNAPVPPTVMVGDLLAFAAGAGAYALFGSSQPTWCSVLHSHLSRSEASRVCARVDFLLFALSEGISFSH
jgi:hypothetical protein